MASLGADQRFTAAIIGLGRIGSLLDDPWADRTMRDESWRLRPCTHAGQYAAHPRIRLVAGADPDPIRREAFVRRWGVPAYADHRTMLAREHPDIVSICTRAADRPQPTLDAIAADVRILLLEKHLAATLRDADQMVAAAAAAGIPVVVNHTFRFDPGVHALAAVIHEGAIGDLRSIVCYPGPRLVHSGVHFFDLCRFLGAGEATRVFGRLDGDPDAPDPPGSGYIEFATGVRAYVDARSRSAHGYMEIHGTQGAARVGNGVDCTTRLWAQEPPNEPSAAYYQPPLVPVAWAPPLDAGSMRRGRNVTAACIDEVIACLDAARSPISSGRDGLLAQEMATALHLSHRRGGILLSLPLEDRDLRLDAV